MAGEASKVGAVSGAGGVDVTNGWLFAKNLNENARNVAELVETLSQAGKGTSGLSNALQQVKNEIMKSGSPSIESLSNLKDEIGKNKNLFADVNKAKAIVDNTIRALEGNDSSSKNRNVDLSKNTREQVEGETQVAASGGVEARNVSGVTGNQNADADQDQNHDSSSSSQDTAAIASNVKELMKNKELTKKLPFSFDMSEKLGREKMGLVNLLQNRKVEATDSIGKAVDKLDSNEITEIRRKIAEDIAGKIEKN